MRTCQRCGKDRILSVGGKSSDCNNWNFQGREGDGYLPRIAGVGGGDYYDLDVCLDCGQLQGTWPQPTPEELEEEAEENIEIIFDSPAQTPVDLERLADQATGVGCVLELTSEDPGWPEVSLYGLPSVIRLLLASWGYERFTIEQMMDGGLRCT